ncbi:MAG: alanine/glycine:cation symporter family protein [Lachnospira sp.]
MNTLSTILERIDSFVWGPVMLCLLVGTGIFLTIRTKALCWRNLPYAVKSVLSKEARQKKGDGDISPFSALTTALAATIGTGNIVGVATAMVSGGPGALVWMWISAAFGITSKFSECMLAIKYREVNKAGEMSGGPMYTMKKGFKNKKVGACLGWLFALFTVLASFGIGNLTQANSISSAMESTFNIPTWITGLIITVLVILIVLGGIQSISKVSQVVVPLMAVCYIVAGLVIILGNIANVPAGIAMIFKMAFSVKAVGGGLCGSIVASMSQAMRFGVARGVFSNEAGMGSAAITAAAATTNDPVRQGYINMTGTFWDTIVVCTITGLCIASTGVLGTKEVTSTGTYEYVEIANDSGITTENIVLTDSKGNVVLTVPKGSFNDNIYSDDSSGDYELSSSDNTYNYKEPLTGAALTIAAFKSILGTPGGWFVCISIGFFAFSTILGWEYHGEKAFEYLLKTHKYNITYRLFFSVISFFGATTTLAIAWTFSDIANALMAIPNLICLIVMSGIIAEEMNRFQPVLEAEKAERKERRRNK